MAGKLNARSATIILLSYLGAQLFGGIVCAMVGFTVMATRGTFGPKQIDAMVNTLDVYSMIPVLLIGGIVMVLTSYKLVQNDIHDITPNGGAWTFGTLWPLLIMLGFGIIAGVCPHLLKFHRSHNTLGDIARMALTPGSPRIVFIVSGILLAPLWEEMLFRGVLYGGYHKSFGPVWAITLTTSLFVIIHVPEYIHFLPGLVALVVGALVTLWCRLRFCAIGPAVAFHAGFNAAQVLILFIAGR